MLRNEITRYELITWVTIQENTRKTMRDLILQEKKNEYNEYQIVS